MRLPFEEVDDEERRFKLIEAPETWEHDIPESLLAKAEPETRERYIMTKIMANKIQWLIERHVELNNNLFTLEAETIRSRRFRRSLIIGGCIVLFLWQLFGDSIKRWLGI
jgi:hypothetical protein